MEKVVTISAVLLSAIFIFLGWINFFEVGCWGVGGRGRSVWIICGGPGLVVGLLFTFFAFYVIRRWLKKADD
jgi:hypothetical protein